MVKNLFLLRETEAFMRGELDNVTVAGGHIMLDMVAGSYVPYGCYTSPAIPMPLFDALRVSWNASTPAGTVVEAQARVMVDGNWNSWCSFGRWSPFIRREGARPMARGPLQLAPDVLTLDSKLGSQVQLRIYLYTKEEKLSPAVRLLGVSVHAVNVIPAGGTPVNARLHLPPYAVCRRAPQLAGCMDLACCVAGLINRWGADVLPEELALAMQDWQGAHAPNLSFAAAAAGAWGFPAWATWTDLAGLRAEVRAGYGAVVRLAAAPAELAAGLPPLRFAALRGFAVQNGTACALLNDPAYAADDFAAETTMPLDDFLVAWDNTALFLRERTGRSDAGRPARTAVSIRHDRNDAPGFCRIRLNGAPHALPEDFCGAPGAPTGVLAWTAPDTRPHATTAHKQFRFVEPADGGIRLTCYELPTKHTVYAIDSSGSMLVGDITL